MPRQIVNRNYIYTKLYLPEGIHIWHNNWLLCVDYNKGLRPKHRCDLGVKGQSQIYLKSICLIYCNHFLSVTQTPLSCFDLGCSYLAKWLLVVCRL